MLARSLLIVISGPSGSGKGTLCDMLRERLPELSYSISLTTRPPRGDERDGVEYLFVTEEDFKEKVVAGEFLEWAEVYGYHYGTLLSTVKNLLDEGSDVLLEIDVQGAQRVKELLPQAVLIFIKPPTMEELCARITKRGTDEQAVIEQRLRCAPEELKAAKHYDYIVDNNLKEEAFADLLEIIERKKELRKKTEGV